MSDNGKVLYLPTAARRGELRAAKQEVSNRFLAPDRVSAFRASRAATSSDPKYNVVGVGIGEKTTQNRHTGVLAVKILVRLKYAENQVPMEHRLPRDWDGLPVDVVQTGTFRRIEAVAAAAADVLPQLPNPRIRMRPAQPGCSVGFEAAGVAMAGTFGLLVKKDGKTFILSNSHVLADEGRLPKGATPIFQPGLLDGGNPATDRVATMVDFVPYVPGGANQVDAAIAEIDPALAARNVLFLGAPRRKPIAAQPDMAVHKFGRTTGYTVGRVISLDTDVSVDYESGTFLFQDQILIDGVNGAPFSAAGDSGSAILQRGTNRPVGLLFAGSSTHTLANHMEQVLSAFGVTIA
ncbi:MAG TPA: hypothetical protein VH394_26955 [Thermoanaerobaculia bacterium]|nr:hypothetical protein [Thermoanaerobaculia bacterium]